MRQATAVLLAALLGAIVVDASPSRGEPAETACRASDDSAITINACSDIIAATPNANSAIVVLAYFRRGYAYFDINDADGGVADIEEALRRDQAGQPDIGAAPEVREELAEARLRGHTILAAIYSDRKKYEAALQHIDAAVDLQPSRRTAALLLALHGEVAFGQKRYDQAVKDFGIAASLNPDNPSFYRRRGDAYSMLHDYDLARGEYDAAIRLNANDPESYRLRCRNNVLAGRLEAALDDCNRMIGLDDKHRTLLVLRGLVYLKMTRFEQAMADFAAVLEESATQPDALFGRGIARLRRGDRGGNADIEAATRFDPEVAERFAQWDLKP